MRRYHRYYLIVLCIAAAAWICVPLLSTHIHAWLQRVQSADEHTVSSIASNSLVYPVKPQHWLSFSLPEGSEQVRIVSNAHIQHTEALTVNPNWTYALRYELVDNKAAVLARGLYHLQARLTTYKDEQGAMLYSHYYADKALVPLDVRVVLLGLSGIKGVAFLRVSLEPVNPAIVEAALRVYVPDKIAEHKIAAAWLRMSRAQKDELAAASNIYPEALLSAAEKLNLLKHQWRPVGPVGIEDQDYQTRTLYTLKNSEKNAEDAVMLAAGLQADAQHYGVIPLPEQGGQLALNVTALDGSPLAAPTAINLQWFGRSIAQRWQKNVEWSKDSTGLNYTVAGGLLVIRPAVPVIINAYLTTAIEARHAITDALLTLKSYRAQTAVDFNVLHYQQHAAALRIDVRQLLTTTEKPAPEGIRYQWLDAQQQVINTGELSALAQPSLFDRVGNINAEPQVSDPLSYYFRLPPHVASLRLFSAHPAHLVSVYNQPYGLAKSQRIPEDAYVANNAQDPQLSWFPLRALNDDILMQQHAIQWVNGQYRPPEDNADVLAGRYLWQDYLPQGRAESRYLLTEYVGDEPRTDALASVYCALPVNRDAAVEINAFNGLRSVAPELIFLREATQPFSAELFLNQQKQFAIHSIGQQGRVPLPKTDLGRYRLRLNTDSGGQWLMNYHAHCAGDKYLKRRVFSIKSGAALDFIVEHGAIDETLSARWYSALNTLERSQLRVDIEPLTATARPALVSTSWTYRQRLYDIRPLATKPMPILFVQNQALSNGERFTIPLNSDLPAGSYRIRIALAQGAEGSVTLSQIKAGINQQRRFYQENENEAP